MSHVHVACVCHVLRQLLRPSSLPPTASHPRPGRAELSQLSPTARVLAGAGSCAGALTATCASTGSRYVRASIGPRYARAARAPAPVRAKCIHDARASSALTLFPTEYARPYALPD